MDSVERHLREATLRIRARGCFGVGTGSGFAIADDILVTNRHVVHGAHLLQVSTWDGRTLDVDVSGYALQNDLAIIRTVQPLPRTLQAGDPVRAGEAVVAVGYPGGQAIDFSHGDVVDAVEGEAFGETAETLRITNEIIPGNSGGPLVDLQGEVVGVVFAIELSTDYGLAVPIESLEAFARSGALFANPPRC